MRFCARLHGCRVRPHANDAAGKTCTSVACGLARLSLGTDLTRVALAEVVRLNAQLNESTRAWRRKYPSITCTREYATEPVPHV